MTNIVPYAGIKDIRKGMPPEKIVAN